MQNKQIFKQTKLLTNEKEQKTTRTGTQIYSAFDIRN